MEDLVASSGEITGCNQLNIHPLTISTHLWTNNKVLAAKNENHTNLKLGFSLSISGYHRNMAVLQHFCLLC